MTAITSLILSLPIGFLIGFAIVWVINAYIFGRFTWKKAMVKYRGRECEIFYKMTKYAEIQFGGRKEWHISYNIKDRAMGLNDPFGSKILIFLNERYQVTSVIAACAFNKGEINPDSWLQRVVLNVPEPVQFENAYALCNSFGSETERKQKLDSLMHPEKAIFQVIIDQLPKV